MARSSSRVSGAAYPRSDARGARTRAAVACTDTVEVRGLPVNEATRRIQAEQTEQEKCRQQAAERARQLDPFDHDPRRNRPRRDERTREHSMPYGAALGLGIRHDARTEFRALCHHSPIPGQSLRA